MPISADDIQPGQLVAAIQKATEKNSQLQKKLALFLEKNPPNLIELHALLADLLNLRCVIGAKSANGTRKYGSDEIKTATALIEVIEQQIEAYAENSLLTQKAKYVQQILENEITERLRNRFRDSISFSTPSNRPPLTLEELKQYKEKYEDLLLVFLGTLDIAAPSTNTDNQEAQLNIQVAIKNAFETIITTLINKTTQKIIDNLTDLELDNVSNEITYLKDYLAFIKDLQFSETAIAILQQYIANVETALAEKIQSTTLQQIEILLSQEKLPSINFLKKYSAELDKILLEAEKLTADQKKAVQEKVLEVHQKVFEKINNVLLSLFNQGQLNTQLFKYAEILLNYYINLYYAFDELLNPPKTLTEQNASGVGVSSSEEKESNENLLDQMSDPDKPSLLYKAYGNDTQNSQTLQSMQTALYAFESVLADLLVKNPLFESFKKDKAHFHLVKTYFLNLCNAGIENIFKHIKHIKHRDDILPLLDNVKNLLTVLDACTQQLSSTQQQLNLPIQFPQNTHYIGFQTPDETHAENNKISAQRNIFALDFYPEPQTIQSLSEAAAFTKKFAIDVIGHWFAKEGRKFLIVLKNAKDLESLKKEYDECKKFFEFTQKELFEDIQVNFPTKVNFEEIKANAVLLNEEKMDLKQMCNFIQNFYLECETKIISDKFVKAGKEFLIELSDAKDLISLKQIYSECKKFFKSNQNELRENIQVNFPTKVNSKEIKANTEFLDEKKMTLNGIRTAIERFYLEYRLKLVDAQIQLESETNNEPPPSLIVPPIVRFSFLSSQPSSEDESDNQLTASSSSSSPISSPRPEQ